MSGPKEDLFVDECGLALCLCLAARGLGLGLLWKKHSLDVWQNTTLGNGDARKKFVQLLVITDCQLQVAGDNSGLLVVAGSISCQLQNFGSQVLEHGSQVDWSPSSYTLCIVALAQQTVDAPNRELQPSTGGARFRFSLDFTSFTTARHD